MASLYSRSAGTRTIGTCEAAVLPSVAGSDRWRTASAALVPRRRDRDRPGRRPRLRRHADATPPAESRINRLAGEIPASFVAFDVLVWDGKRHWRSPLAERRETLEKVADGIVLSPCSLDRGEALEWLTEFEAIGLDGAIAKRRDEPYRAGDRSAVVKVKPEKTADCVVAGVRWKAGDRTRLATLLLGLYGEDGELDYVGSAAVAPARHDELLALVMPLLRGGPERRFSEPNRWGGGELAEAAVRPELVVEVRYDKVQGRRFRHGTKLLRLRPDKSPEQCTWRELLPPVEPGMSPVADWGVARPLSRGAQRSRDRRT